MGRGHGTSDESLILGGGGSFLTRNGWSAAWRVRDWRETIRTGGGVAVVAASAKVRRGGWDMCALERCRVPRARRAGAVVDVMAAVQVSCMCVRCCVAFRFDEKIVVSLFLVFAPVSFSRNRPLAT